MNWQIFSVGGAVRDDLLGRPVGDRDWVVVGATPQDLLDQGFKPVGRDFPVFLHPTTHEEYALARTERKSAPGYKGFIVHAAPEVTLEEDLARRDLTINAIARSACGEYIDPFNGRADLAAKVLRHVSPAFAEDPLRILRVARFAARFADFSIAQETYVLLRSMVENGEVDHLKPERTWQELARGLMEARPGRMIEVLRECGALKRILPEVDALFGVPQRADYHPEVDCGAHLLLVLDMAAHLSLPLAARFAALTHDLGKATTPPELLPRHQGHELRSAALIPPLCQRLRVPAECRDLALLVARYHADLACVSALRANTIVRLLEACDALRRPERFRLVLAACAADHRGRGGMSEAPYLPGEIWLRLLDAVRAVDAGAIARASNRPALIAERIRQARIEAVKQFRSAHDG